MAGPALIFVSHRFSTSRPCLTLSRKGDGVKSIPLDHASSAPPASAVSSPPHRRAWCRRPQPGSPWRSPAPGAWDLRRALVPWASGAIGPSHESRGGLACHFLRDASTLAVGLPLHIIEAEDPVGAAWLPGVGLIRERTGGCPPRGLLQGLGNAVRRIPGPFVTPMLHYQEGVMILLQDGPQLGRR